MSSFLTGNIDQILRIFLLLGTILYLGVILLMLKKKLLTVRYSIIWLLSGLVLLVFAAAPYVVYVIGNLLHIEMPSNLVFTMLFAFMLLLLLSLSSTVSCFAEKIKRLSQQAALLEKRVRELEAAQNQNRSNQ